MIQFNSLPYQLMDVLSSKEQNVRKYNNTYLCFFFSNHNHFTIWPIDHCCSTRQYMFRSGTRTLVCLPKQFLEH